jgi:hypothetical protein
MLNLCGSMTGPRCHSLPTLTRRFFFLPTLHCPPLPALLGWLLPRIVPLVGNGRESIVGRTIYLFLWYFTDEALPSTSLAAHNKRSFRQFVHQEPF